MYLYLMHKDVKGISLLHWAAGSGNQDGLEELTRALPGGIDEALHLKAERDGATILHWAAVGVKPKAFGCGGHFDVCCYLLKHCGGADEEKEIVNSLTKDENSVLMWAAWSGTLDVVKLMIRHRADARIRNRNGCTVAHWAASGGNLEVCKYLFNCVGVDFEVPNDAGNTPLSHAVAYGRIDVIKWLREQISVRDVNGTAHDLARDFLQWEAVEKRREVFDLFEDWYSESNY